MNNGKGISFWFGFYNKLSKQLENYVFINNKAFLIIFHIFLCRKSKECGAHRLPIHDKFTHKIHIHESGKFELSRGNFALLKLWTPC